MLRLAAWSACLHACWGVVQQAKVESCLYARLVQVKAP